MLGTGGFTKRGVGVLTLNRHNASSCTYTGPTTILGGGLVVTSDDYKPGRGALSVAPSCFLDLNGINCEFESAAGAGVVTNCAETAATLSLGYNNANGDWNAAVASTISVEKIGTGTLTIGANAAAYAGDLTVSAGTAKLSAGVSMTGLGTVTIAKGATLDIRGATIGCKKFVNEGTLLSDGTGSLVLGGDEDQDFENPAFAGSVEKTGSATMALHGGLDDVTSLKVSQGTLRYFPTAFSGKYFKLTFVGGSDWTAYTISEMSLFDADGNRINQGTYSYSGDKGGVNTLDGISACETALMGAGGSYHHAHNDNEGPNTLFDGNTLTTCVLRYSWGNSAVGFRIADNAAPAVGYSLTSSGVSSCVGNGLSKWTLHGSYDGVNWILLDDRSGEAQTIPTTTATEYNGGRHYLFASGVVGDVIPGTLGSVEVATGAALDPSVETVGIATLTVDCAAGAGSITRFTPAENGTLVLKNIEKSALGSAYVLPITVGTVATPSNLKTWKISIGGQIVDGYRVRFRDGKLMVCGAGLFIVVQ